jgi:hypothetical protein
LPDDPGHLVAVEFDDRVGHLDFCHGDKGLWSRALRGGMDGSAYSTVTADAKAEWAALLR